MSGQTVRRIVQKFCEGCIDFVHEIEYNKFELNKIAARWPAKAMAQFFFTL